MKTAFIFHGTEGYPEENWFPWMKSKLEEKEYQVFVPQFPTPENQTLENWFKVFEKYEEFYDSETTLIGHSLGGTFLLRVLEKYNVEIEAAYVVAAPVGILPIKNYDGDKLFIKDPFNWDEIRKNSKKFAIYQSDDDPFVCLGNGEKIAEKLQTPLTFIPNAGHFNAKAGYLEFEDLYEKITGDQKS